MSKLYQINLTAEQLSTIQFALKEYQDTMKSHMLYGNNLSNKEANDFEKKIASEVNAEIVDVFYAMADQLGTCNFAALEDE